MSADGDPGRCQFVELPGGAVARVYGGPPLDDRQRETLVKLAEAAREIIAEESVDMPALTAIADAFAHRARTSGLTLAEAAKQAGCDRVAADRLMRCSEKLASDELAAFAVWAGCEQALTVALGEIERRRNG